jgi:SOS response regulatory protein OraA/RecX
MTATVTALRRRRPGHVAVEVDGRPWRDVPDEAVLKCGLAPGVALERPLLRLLRRELRRAEALEAATRMLARRDLSRSRLDNRLAARGATTAERERAVGTLEAAGLVDDGRFARTRAAELADRGWGDSAIEARLEGEGLDLELVRSALADLAPESERAAVLAARQPDRRKCWSLLARRGFGPDAIDAALGPLDEEPGGGLG